MSAEIAKSLMLLATEYEFVFEPNRVKIWMTGLAPYGADLVAKAVHAFMTDPVNGRFKPKLADIVGKCDLLRGGDGRPADGEAWAIALPSQDEAETVIWTQEIIEAWNIARPVLLQGDETGARMAFRDAYNRLIAKSRAEQRPVKWQTSLGHDPARREAAIAQAFNAGLLPLASKQMLLPAANKTQEISESKHAENMARLRAELGKLESPMDRLAKMSEEKAFAERLHTLERKAAIKAQAFGGKYEKDD